MQMRWDLRSYQEIELLGDQLLSTVITLTSKEDQAYATSCKDYMEWQWPRSGLATLEFIEEYARRGNVVDQIQKNLTSGVSVDISQVAHLEKSWIQEVSVTPNGPLYTVIETSQQLAWLSAIFRGPIADQLSVSRTVFQRTGPGVFNLSLLDLVLVKGFDARCWHSLFVGAVIPRGFPIPLRLSQAQNDLELPLTIMTSLASVLYPVNYDGGLVLQGFSSLSFPTALQSGSVQWHYILDEDRNTQLSTASVSEFDRVKGVSLEGLVPLKTFLGYCRTVIINLGTEQSGYDRIGYSPASADKWRVEITSTSLRTGTSGLSIAGISASVMASLSRGLQGTARIDHYKEILRTTRDMSVVLYDAEKGEERGWLVSMLSAILHMAHVCASQVKTEPEQRIRHAINHWDGGKSAYDVFREHSGVVLERSLVERTEYRLKDLVIRFCGEPNNRPEEQRLTRKTASGGIVLYSKRLRCWGFMEIVRPAPLSSMEMQELHSDCSWNRLGEEILILFCQGLGEPIKPASECEVYQSWNPVPRGHGYLIASEAFLESLSKQKGATNKVTNSLYWQSPDSALFEDCQHTPDTHCRKEVQHLRER